jgi:hypothetical protein
MHPMKGMLIHQEKSPPRQHSIMRWTIWTSSKFNYELFNCNNFKSRSEFSHCYEQRDRQSSLYTIHIPFAYLHIGSPSAYFPSSAYFALSWLTIRHSTRVLLSQVYLHPSSPLAFCCSRYLLQGSPSVFYKKNSTCFIVPQTIRESPWSWWILEWIIINRFSHQQLIHTLLTY